MTFAFNGQGSKIGCSLLVRHALSQNHKKSAGGHMAHFCLFGIDWLVNNIDHSYPVSLLVTRNGVFMLTQGKKRNGGARTREEYVGNVPISPLGTPFSSVHGSTHYLQMTELQYVNSSITIELQI